VLLQLSLITFCIFVGDAAAAGPARELFISRHAWPGVHSAIRRRLRARRWTFIRMTGESDEMEGEESREQIPSDLVMRRSEQWGCVRNCGACCRLADWLPNVDEIFLYGKDKALFLSMIRPEDGYCRHFDQDTRSCTIYHDRPWFCRVEADIFGHLYGMAVDEMDEFCRECCRDQIRKVFGADSTVRREFDELQERLEQEMIDERQPRIVPRHAVEMGEREGIVWWEKQPPALPERLRLWRTTDGWIPYQDYFDRQIER